MLTQDQLGDEFRRSLRGHMLQDVNFLIQPLNSLLVALVTEVPILPPQTFLLHEAAEATLEHPSAVVLRESIEELATLDDSALHLLIGLLAIVDGGFILVTLRRGRVDATNERGVEFEIFIRRNHEAQSQPDDGCETTNQTEDQIQRVDGPSNLTLLPRLDDLRYEDGLLVVIVADHRSETVIDFVVLQISSQVDHADL